MSTYWFRPKRYGYGATPTTWQGWVVTLAGAAVIAASTMILMAHTTLGLLFWAALAVDVIVVVALVQVCRRKTEGEWRWRWGGQE